VSPDPVNVCGQRTSGPPLAKNVHGRRPSRPASTRMKAPTPRCSSQSRAEIASTRRQYSERQRPTGVKCYTEPVACFATGWPPDRHGRRDRRRRRTPVGRAGAGGCVGAQRWRLDPIQLYSANLETPEPEARPSWASTERGTGIEPALPAWESNGNRLSAVLTCACGCPRVTPTDPCSPWLIAR
jgi:hypothetical protein